MKNVNLGLEGWFTLTVTDQEGNVKRKLTFPNLITNLGLDGIGTNGISWTTTIGLGTGTAAPNVLDTSLSGTTFSMTTLSVTKAHETGSPRYTWARWSKQSAKGAAAGTWTEVGIGRSLTSLWSRELIRDTNGLPTSFVVTSIDYLTLEYELRVYYNESDLVGVRVISGTSYTYTIRPGVQQATSLAEDMTNGTWMNGTVSGTPGSISLYNGALNAAYATPGGTFAESTTPYSVAAYVGGTYKKVNTYTIGELQGNLSGGITVVVPFVRGDRFSTPNAPFKIGFSPALAKDATKTASLTFSFFWGRRGTSSLVLTGHTPTVA